MDPINLFSDRSGGLFAVLAFFSVFSDFLLSIFSLYYLTFVCRSKNSPPDCFLNARFDSLHPLNQKEKTPFGVYLFGADEVLREQF